MQEAHRTRGEESRARLLAVAARAFALHGYHETKVSTIVADAGVSQPAFYLYFPSKEAIFAELVHSFHQRFRALTENDELFRAGHPLSYVTVQVQASIEAIFQLFADDPNITRMSLFQAPSAEQIKQEMTERFHHRLRMMQEAGYIRSDVSIDIMADCWLGTMERLTERYLLTGKCDAQSLAKQATNIILKGMLTEQAPITRADEEATDVHECKC
jgi:TetR/AcrR family transcriptional regulator, fatty acid metabolism regulator protein